MTYRVLTQDDIPVFADIAGRSFRYDSSRMLDRLTEGTHRYTFRDARLWEDGERGAVAGMVLFTRSLSLLGGELEATLLATVSVPPDQRRRGYANAMLTASLQEGYEQKIPLSLLFPYAIPFYNRLGYGIGQEVWLLELDLRELMDFDEARLTRRMTEADLPAMQRLYGRERANHNGWLSRTEWEWRERVLDIPVNSGWPNRSEGVIVPGRTGEVRGYLTYSLGPVEGEKRDAVVIQEWVSEDDEAWRALAGFVAAQRAQASFVRYTAPVGFPLVHALAERNSFRNRRPMEFVFRDTLAQGAGMMVRLLHAEEAFRQRRYPQQARGACVVQIRDVQLPANETPLRLVIEGGRAEVTRLDSNGGTTPTAAADVRTWSELFAGTLTPAHARRLGRLQADDETVVFLANAFAAEPWYLHRADWF